MASSSDILTVGVGNGYEYSTIAAAVAAAQNGQTIDVAAGTYVNDTATINTNITLQAVGGPVILDETQALPNEKGIFVTNANAVISGFTFEGAEVSDNDGGNGAGIRYQAGNLTLIDDTFQNNQDGILATPLTNATGTIDVEGSEFINNGSGSGYTHNLYIGDVAKFIFNDSYSAQANVGHEIKSRAEDTIITSSRIQDNNGTASYSIDLPNGGNATIANNLIEQGPNSQNPIIISYGEEGNLRANSSLTMTGNTVVNDLTSFSYMLVNDAPNVTAQLSDNATWGLSSSELVSGPATISGETQLAARPTGALDAPWAPPSAVSLTGLPSGETLPDNCQTLPFTGFQISDQTANAVVEAVVKLSSPIGRLDGGAGTVSADGQTYTTLSGQANFVQSALRGLTFYAGATATNQSAQLSVTVTDSAGNTATDATTITTESLAAPTRMNFVFFTSGDDTIAAPALKVSNVFIEDGATIGSDVIGGFDPAKDILQLSSAAFPDLAHVLAATTSVSGGSLITLDAKDTISLPGVAPGALNAQNIQLV